MLGFRGWPLQPEPCLKLVGRYNCKLDMVITALNLLLGQYKF